MRYSSGHKSNCAAGWHWRFASADADHHGQDARATRRANSIANRKSRMAPPSPLAPTTSWCPPKGEGTKRRETASDFVRNSSFILHPFRRGVTLVEMLIVISIMVILMVGAFKVMQPLADRRVREAARAVNVYISSARNRAIEIGRPCGVIFRRATSLNMPAAAMVLDQCEVPPPYAGDETNSMVQVQDWTYTSTGTPYWIDPITSRMKYVLKVRIQYPVNISNNMIRPGDLIQFNNQGPYFSIEQQDINASPPISDFPLDSSNSIFFDFFTNAADTNSDGWVDNYVLTLTMDPQETPLQMFPWPKYAITPNQWSLPLSFKILRQPMKSSASPLQLPAGAAVDLAFSSTGPAIASTYDGTINRYTSNAYFADDVTHKDVAVIFSGNGSVEGYYYLGVKHPVAGPIFFLIGQSKLIDPLNNSNDDNATNLSNFWVTINIQTGLVSTDEMAAGSDPLLYARESLSTGGR
jgi:prepilin-type N-terminal cleavage/methylation domain-containing protein